MEKEIEKYFKTQIYYTILENPRIKTSKLLNKFKEQILDYNLSTWEFLELLDELKEKGKIQ